MRKQLVLNWRRASLLGFAGALLATAVTVVVVVAIAGLGSDGGSDDGAAGGDQPQVGGDGGVNPAHEAVLLKLPTPAAATKDGADVSNGNGTFAVYRAKGTLEDVASFYLTAAASAGWTSAAGSPTALTSGKSQQTIESFPMKNLSLTVYLDENPDKGGDKGNIEIMLRVQDR